jgi:hypothetical protein
MVSTSDRRPSKAAAHLRVKFDTAASCSGPCLAPRVSLLPKSAPVSNLTPILFAANPGQVLISRPHAIATRSARDDVAIEPRSWAFSALWLMEGKGQDDSEGIQVSSRG